MHIEIKLPQAQRQHAVTKYFINALLIFCGVYGALDTCLTSFAIAYHRTALLLVLFIGAVFFAFMYYNKVIRQICYILLLFFTTGLVWQYRVVINSGFSGILNVALEYVESYFKLPRIKRYTEVIKDREFAVTICLIFLGIMLEVLLNIIISEYMNLFGVLLITLPIAQAGMYFELSPDRISCFMLFFCWIMVAIIRFSGSYSMAPKKKRNKSVEQYGKKEKSRNRMIFAVTALLCLLYGTIGIVMPKEGFMVPEIFTVFKDKTDEPIRNFIIGGFEALFHRQQGAGGVNAGKLGRVSSIRFDYKTDLTVKLVPYTRNRVYFKAYTGSIYKGDHWETLKGSYVIGEGSREEKLKKIINIPGEILKENFLSNRAQNSCKVRMEVKNIDANSNYVYLPYYTPVQTDGSIRYLKDDIIWKGENPSGIWDLECYPGILKEDLRTADGSDNEKVEKEYRRYVKENYLSVPEQNRALLVSMLQKANVRGNMSERIEQIRAFLENDYEYSLRPGMTPEKKDFVSYFLTENKKGYCAHFASAAVLLLREAGVPARYVEGYVMDFSDMLEGSRKKDENIADYFEGNRTLNLPVMEVNINDSGAHAWVEVYQDGFGWMPVEMTPGSSEIELGEGVVDYGNFGTAIKKAFNSIKEINFLQILEKVKYILLVLTLFGVLMLAFWTVHIISLHHSRKKLLNSKNYNLATRTLYLNLIQLLKYGGFATEEGMSYEEYTAMLYGYEWIEGKDLTKVTKIFEKAEYGRQSVTQEEYGFAREELLDLSHKTYQKLSFFKKFVVRFIKVLY